MRVKITNLIYLHDIPLSCLQLAIYNPLIASPKEVQSKKYGNCDEFDEWCRKEVKNQKLHVLIPLICEIDLIRLSIETLEKLKSGIPSSWKEVDHLQFLIAVLRGHWGMNTSAAIKEWATFHLMEVMRDLKQWLILKDRPDYDEFENLLIYSTKSSWSFDSTWLIDHLKIQPYSRKEIAECNCQEKVKDHIEHYLHQYRLCCMCYVLLCDDSFVKVNEKYGIIACTSRSSVLDQFYDVTTTGYIDISTSICAPKLNELLHPFPDELELPTWKDLSSQHCRYISNCLNLYNKRSQSWPIRNYTYQRAGNQNVFHYTRDEFMLVIGALSDYVKPTEDALQNKLQTILAELQNCNENGKLPQNKKTRARKIQQLSLEKRERIIKECEKIEKTKDVSTLNRSVILEREYIPIMPARLRKRVIRPMVFSVKKFYNADPRSYFDEDELLNKFMTVGANDDPQQSNGAEKITFFETKVVLDYDYANQNRIADTELQRCYKDEHATSEITQQRFEVTKTNSKKSWRLVNFCRFVFARFNNPSVNNKITGILFFTDSHYGDQLIEFDQQHKQALQVCTGQCFDKFKCKIYLDKLCSQKCRPKTEGQSVSCSDHHSQILQINQTRCKTKLCSVNLKAEVYLKDLCVECLKEFNGRIHCLCPTCQKKMHEITIVRRRLQDMLYSDCLYNIDKLETSQMPKMNDICPKCKDTLGNVDLKEEDKLCKICYDMVKPANLQELGKQNQLTVQEQGRVKQSQEDIVKQSQENIVKQSQEDVVKQSQEDIVKQTRKSIIMQPQKHNMETQSQDQIKIISEQASMRICLPEQGDTLDTFLQQDLTKESTISDTVKQSTKKHETIVKYSLEKEKPVKLKSACPTCQDNMLAQVKKYSFHLRTLAE